MLKDLAHEGLSINAGIVTRFRMPVRAALLGPLPFRLGELTQHLILVKLLMARGLDSDTPCRYLFCNRLMYSLLKIGRWQWAVQVFFVICRILLIFAKETFCGFQ